VAELSRKQLERTGKKADKAYAAGRTDEALSLYREILEGSKTGDQSRQNALYGVVMSRLTGDASGRESEEVQRLLAEIEESFPGHPRKLELAVVSAWMAEVETTRLEAEKNASELEALRADFEESKEVITGAAGDQVKSCQEKLSSTQRSLRGARSELAKKNEELEKKEAALQKLKNAILGPGGR
jgi:chromosome segregation ATPase